MCFIFRPQVLSRRAFLASKCHPVKGYHTISAISVSTQALTIKWFSLICLFLRDFLKNAFRCLACICVCEGVGISGTGVIDSSGLPYGSGYWVWVLWKTSQLSQSLSSLFPGPALNSFYQQQDFWINSGTWIKNFALSLTKCSLTPNCKILKQWFSTFLILWHFNTVPYSVITQP